MKKLLLIILALSTCAFSAPAQRTSPRPAPAKTPPPAPRVPAEMPRTIGLYVDRYILNIDVNSDGTAVRTYEAQMRFDSPLAVSTFAKFQKIFNGDLEKAEVIDAYFVRKGAKDKTPLPAEAIRIMPTPQAEAAPAFSSLKILEIDFAGVKEGDTVYYKYRTTITKPNFPGHFDDFDVFLAGLEWNFVEINLSAPSNYPLYTQVFGLEGGKLPDENGRAKWQWRKVPSKAMEVESPLTDFMWPSSKIGITSFKNFDELGAAFWSAAESKAVITPEIKELAERITKDISDPRQQAYAIYEWVNKNIRYLSVVLDRGGWIPHDAPQILKNGYGDCKDYTILIKTLLKVKGIESYPVILRSDITDWAPDLAVSSYFNHAILYIPSLDLFADATAANSRLGMIPQTVAGKRGFLSGEKTGVIKTPGDQPEANEVLSDITVNYALDGSIKSVSKNVYKGRSEIMFRPIFSKELSTGYSEFFVKAMLAYYGLSGTGRLSKIGNPYKMGEPFEVEMEVELPGASLFMPKGSLSVPVGLNLMNMLELQRFVWEEKRVTNLLLGASHLKETFLLNFPAGVRITEMPPALSFDNPAGTVNSHFKIEGNSVRVTRELIIKKDISTPADYPGVRDLIGKAMAGFTADFKYETDPAVVKTTRAAAKVKAPVAPAPTSPDGFLESLLGSLTAKKLTAREVAQMESLLVREPENTDIRKKLLAHYSRYDAKPAPATGNARLRHRLWFVRNRPELDTFEVSGIYGSFHENKDAEFETLKAEWLKQVETHPGVSPIRLNAASFLKYLEPETAIRILSEGEKADAEEYNFPLELAELYYRQYENKRTAAELKAGYLSRAFETGERALLLIKKERSRERDRDRKQLLTDLAKAGLELKKYDRVRALATELILDFGNDADDSTYEDATHTGNIFLGRVALSQNDVAKAKEHLLIAMRAPLRSETPWLSDIDFELARGLLAKGEKEAVLEYLRLCLTLREKNSSEDIFKSEIAALKSWQEQVKTGKMPSFDFNKP